MTWLRSDGGPVFYGYSNRTPVTGDVQMISTCLVFGTIFVAFLIIFPGVRKERFTTFTTVTLSLFVGNVILVSILGSSWHVARTVITSAYRALSKELITAELGAYVGLGHINITLTALPTDNSSMSVEDISFNERFSWLEAHEMGESYQAALYRGLPFPILTVAEYFSLGQEGFAWGGQYRAAGYYGTIFLWTAFVSWFLMNVLLVVVPRYGAYTMMATGSFMVGATAAYHCMLPWIPLVIRFQDDKFLLFKLGWCFWLTLFTGMLCIAVGLIIVAVDCVYPHKFSTILEVDFDTPYDRHIIIEDSSTRKKRVGKSLEEPEGLGRRILRRLSSKKDDETNGQMKLAGMENRGFELDPPPPNSPWRFPYNRPAAQGVKFNRSVSQDSMTSQTSSLAVSFNNRDKSRLSILKKSSPAIRPVPGSAQPTAVVDRAKEVSMW
ncbi:dual oxidase maturation factor 1 isoform X1 [Adelges cooleyi]|uniref:dual oxidase maturation factor 1 isoform X1 n=2 Tax=Adelges cooleyi TaxID=133065 RepID=UPI00218051BB|nr:dual oxidase maturation factor 1 isoform X1 [Adelges cooleyi]XP_050421198.1 dual oxidase maturation factor 1 isoform X1 [Adelges cooleyi]